MLKSIVSWQGSSRLGVEGIWKTVVGKYVAVADRVMVLKQVCCVSSKVDGSSKRG